MGRIVIEVDPAHAPISAGDFLRYVDRHLYDGATFYRTVRADNDHGSPPIQIIQGGLRDERRALPRVRHETTATTGIHHLNGVISLARGAVGSGGASAFFICVGDQLSLDFGGARNPDGQGFAAFGRVIEGMDVVRAIQRQPTSPVSGAEYAKGQLLAPPVVIRSAYRR